MSGIIKSFLPLLKKLRLKRYMPEIFLLTLATIITIVVLTIYINSAPSENKEIEDSKAPQTSSASSSTIFVDVSGAVKNPDVYQVSFGARIHEVIDKAGGLSDDADLMFFNRNFNLARIIVDQEKIYVPSKIEIDNGIFIQNQRTLDYTLPSEVLAEENSQQSESLSLINVNSATIEELDQLPGIGLITANKIITNRPYLTINELLTKKAINKSVLEKIKNLISI
jgi:competence protein ComEA